MSVSSSWYGQAFVSAFNKEIDFASDDIRVMLTTSAYVPDLDNHRYKSSVTNEIVASGYTAGGMILGSPTVVYDGSLNQFTLFGDDLEWNPSSISGARRAVVYDRTPATDATRPLIYLIDFGIDVSSVGGVFQILWADAGLGRVTVI